jgi:hypothetical protein
VNDYPFSTSINELNEDVRARLDRFKADLPHSSAEGMVIKHILMGDCYILDHDEKYNLCSAVSQQYGVRPERVYVVGSGKLGFSIARQKRYRPFGIESDIDLAIVSEDLFDQIWMEVVRYDAQHLDWSERKSKFRRYLMNGWIRPDALPPADSFPRTREWWRFFEQVSNRTMDGRFKVNAGLYRTEAFLEMYHVRAVASCKADVELSR